MRNLLALALVLLAACDSDHHPGVDAPSADPLALRAHCSFALGPNGEIALPDTIEIDQKVVRPVDLLNTSGTTINGTENFVYTVEGADAADFEVKTTFSAGSPDAASCGAHDMLGRQLPPDAACRLDIEFHPSSPGAKQASVHITYFDQVDQSFELRGTGVTKPATVFADVVDLYITKAAAQPSPYSSFSIINNSNLAVDLGDLSVAAPFTLTTPGSNCPSPLPAGSSCKVETLGYDESGSGTCLSGSVDSSTDAVTVPLTAE